MVSLGIFLALAWYQNKLQYLCNKKCSISDEITAFQDQTKRLKVVYFGGTPHHVRKNFSSHVNTATDEVREPRTLGLYP
jgi:hypothetical protein